MQMMIRFSFDELELPVSHQYAIQGLIYHLMDQSSYGRFLHQQGYSTGKRAFKLFTFSNLIGKAEAMDKKLVFHNQAALRIASASQDFLQEIYNSLIKDPVLELKGQRMTVQSVDFYSGKPFQGSRVVCLRTLSPVTAYQSENKKYTYYSPEQPEFWNLCQQNLKHKMALLGLPDEWAELEKSVIKKSKKRIVQYKKSFYVAYQIEFEATVNFASLQVLLDTGLSAKNSCGFGMLELIL